MKRLMKMLFRVGLLLAALVAIAIASRRFWLPERFAVNVPISALVGSPSGSSAGVDGLRPPQGFTLSRFATGLTNARFLRVTDQGDVLVSQPREGRVTLLRKDSNSDGSSDETTVLLEGLNRPHGLALRDGYLYVAEMTAVGRVRFDSAARTATGAFERVITGLPSGGNHWTRTIGFGPDGFLYVSVGSSCNVCVEEDDRRAAISRYDPRTWRGAVFASGLRNSVGFAWRTVSTGEEAGHELIATDNGRDLLGNDFPPCELNRVVEGGFYGWPFANGDRVKDPDFGTGQEARIAASLPPVHRFAAHNAPLGITFLDSPATPAEYRGAALVALHGSWNRTTKDGYKVVSLHWDEAGRITQRDFLTGFLVNENVSGRPVDAAQAADGTIYISDDFGGAIFRLTVGSHSPTTSVSTAPKVSDGLESADPLDDAAVTRGAKTWEENQCRLCHDPAVVARGQSPVETPKILQKLNVRYDVRKMVAYLKAPQPPMPLFEMSDQERLDLSIYLLKTYR